MRQMRFLQTGCFQFQKVLMKISPGEILKFALGKIKKGHKCPFFCIIMPQLNDYDILNSVYGGSL